MLSAESSFFVRSADAGEDTFIPLHQLTTMERRVLDTIHEYQQATDEACPSTYLARRLRRHHSTIQDHLESLHRKGWLRSPNAPAFLRRAVH